MKSPTRSSAAISRICATNSAISCCKSRFFHARMAEEEGRFEFGDVVEAITAKLIRRHPHVFADARNLSADEVKALPWGQDQGAGARARRR